MIVESRFRPAPWLKNPHLQTLYASQFRPNPHLKLRRERLDLADGDFIDIDWTTGQAGPIVVVLHGLTGNIRDSKYARGLMCAVHERGWRAVFMHFRGASEEPNRLPRGYHSGDYHDFAFLLKTLREREPNTPMAAVGYSLGGNVLLKWLGETGETELLQTAVAVSVPFDLSLCAEAINRGLSKLYQRHLIGEMRREVEKKFAVLEPPFELPDLDTLRNFWAYDDAVTAPLNGFADVHDYYQRCSSSKFLPGIKLPTLIIHAKDDPFMSPEVIPQADELSAQTTLELSGTGGHVGFVSNQRHRPWYWLEERIPQHLQSFIDADKAVAA